MLQNSISIKNRHQKFVEQVVKNETVWVLKSEEGFATSNSTEFKNENGKPLGIICFWSDEKLAKVCAKKHWKEYKPTKIRLAEFLENWCVGMHNDNLLIGTNFDWNLFGQENQALELIIEIMNELQKRNKELDLYKFESVEELKIQVQNTLKAKPSITTKCNRWLYFLATFMT